MDVLITDSSVSASSFCAEAQCGKVLAVVNVHSRGLTVICQNAAHRVWKGFGKTFRTAEEALGAYKSPEMKSIIRAVVALAPAA